MTLLDVIYDFAQNETVFVKIETRVLNLQLDEAFGANLPKASF